MSCHRNERASLRYVIRETAKLKYLNIFWIVLPGLFFAWGIYVALTWDRFLGR